MGSSLPPGATPMRRPGTSRLGSLNSSSICRFMASSAACARASETPGRSLATTWKTARSRRSRTLSASSGATAAPTESGSQMSATQIMGDAPWKSSGATPISVHGCPLMVSGLPMAAGSEPRWLRQKR